ncbi:MAG: hypothetical protein HYV07_03230 [Deltaproteobacteria bacterium]|nr:hypothetical protein [Deltaproteobacteria bacterium]
MALEPLTVWVRPVPASYARCIRTSREPIDRELAVTQHEAYVRALESLGARVIVLPALDELADSVFLEDAAVVLTGSKIFLSRPGAPSRVLEAEALAKDLAGPLHAPRFELVEPPWAGEPWTLDGGDVLRARDDLFFVGASARTNAAGARRLAAAAAPARTVSVPVGPSLHLKSSVTLVREDLLIADRSVDPAPFRAEGFEIMVTDEPYGANVLSLGKSVLVSSAAPRTAARLRATGMDVHVLEVSEIHKGNGALTCLSLRFAGSSAFAT